MHTIEEVEMLLETELGNEVDDVAEMVDAVHDARATAADGTLGIVHTVKMGRSGYDYD